MTAVGSPKPFVVWTQSSEMTCAEPVLGDPMAEEEALATEGPDAVESPGMKWSEV